MSESASNRVAVVTGAGRRRIGNCVARMLAERGFDIVLHYHSSRDAARDGAAELRGLGTRVELMPADVTKESDVDHFFDAVWQRFGRLDVLVTTASVWCRKSLEQVTADDLRRNFDVDTLGTFLCCRRAGLLMAQQKHGGAIVTLGDWAISRPYPDHAAYFVAKGAIPTLTRMLAVELAQRNPAVRVNCIMPGPVMLPADLPDEERRLAIGGTLVRREGRPEDVGSAVLFLVENCFVTGTSLVVDGGRTIAGGEGGFAG